MISLVRVARNALKSPDHYNTGSVSIADSRRLENFNLLLTSRSQRLHIAFLKSPLASKP